MLLVYCVVKRHNSDRNMLCKQYANKHLHKCAFRWYLNDNLHLLLLHLF